MGKTTALIRIRFPDTVVARLDDLAVRLGIKLNRTVPRAALIRALVLLHADAFATGEIVVALDTDPVKRGRAKDPRLTPSVPSSALTPQRPARRLSPSHAP